MSVDLLQNTEEALEQERREAEAAAREVLSEPRRPARADTADAAASVGFRSHSRTKDDKAGRPKPSEGCPSPGIRRSGPVTRGWRPAEPRAART
ncbi:MAG: hypothetical protein QOE86_4289 [Solirubrobacteraceae bacterium]|nr:hypothetical protein [Solirubrobacteraceae bacterium]